MSKYALVLWNRNCAQLDAAVCQKTSACSRLIPSGYLRSQSKRGEALDKRRAADRLKVYKWKTNNHLLLIRLQLSLMEEHYRLLYCYVANPTHISIMVHRCTAFCGNRHLLETGTCWKLAAAWHLSPNDPPAPEAIITVERVFIVSKQICAKGRYQRPIPPCFGCTLTGCPEGFHHPEVNWMRDTIELRFVLPLQQTSTRIPVQSRLVALCGQRRASDMTFCTLIGRRNHQSHNTARIITEVAEQPVTKAVRSHGHALVIYVYNKPLHGGKRPTITIGHNGGHFDKRVREIKMASDASNAHATLTSSLLVNNFGRGAVLILGLILSKHF
ncbi:hypothetical protein J6590_076443 [Homalodisca vitripennis]|nr:hypothetical protein J6590_076443 [Homalodisca vitripennis]